MQKVANAARMARDAIKRKLYIPVERAHMSKETRETLNQFTRGRGDNFVLVCAELYKTHVLDLLIKIGEDVAKLDSQGQISGSRGYTASETATLRLQTGYANFADAILVGEGDKYSLHEAYAQSPHTSMFWFEALGFKEIPEGNAAALLDYIAEKNVGANGKERLWIKPWFEDLCAMNANDPRWKNGFELFASEQRRNAAKPPSDDFEGRHLS